MQSACERLPVELWTQIIRNALNYSSLVDIDDQEQNQHKFEQGFRHYNTKVQRLLQQEQERTRQCLRGVCHSWQALTDLTFGGWCEVNDLITTGEIHPPNLRIAWRIDCFLTPEPGSSESEQKHIRALDKTNISEGTKHHEAQILTLNSPVSPIDPFLHSHGHLFPALQLLDLRPASTFLTPTGGVSAGPEFFSTLSTLFPNLSILLIDLPSSGVSDVLNFPRLRRLSYNVIGQSRLSDWKRCARIAEWILPVIEHVSLNPVGCDEDWEMLISAMRAWGAGLRSLCWGAEFPDKQGITIGPNDWSACPGLMDLKYNTATVWREKGGGLPPSNITDEIPTWHPFNRIQIREGEISPPTNA